MKRDEKSAVTMVVRKVGRMAGRLELLLVGWMAV